MLGVRDPAASTVVHVCVDLERPRRGSNPHLQVESPVSSPTGSLGEGLPPKRFPSRRIQLDDGDKAGSHLGRHPREQAQSRPLDEHHRKCCVDLAEETI